MNARILRLGILVSFLLASSSFVQGGDYIDAVKAKKILVTTTAGNGRKHLYIKSEHPEVTALTVEIPPGAETGWHLHTVPVYAYVLTGNLSVEISDGKTLAFKAGDAIVEVQNLAHNGRNLGNELVRLVVFYTGEEARPNVTKVEQPARKP